jgi:Zn-dependent peptidase ImmA (M78 family)
MIEPEVKSVLDDVTSTAPVDVAEAARRLGVKIYAAKLADKVSGVLVRDPKYGTASGFVIFVEQSEPAVRQRFTAAHELGHFVLHKKSVGHKNEDNYLLRSDGMSSRQEVEANQFAASLLMPMDLIEQAMKSGITTPSALAKHFKVSEIAMSIRLGLPT